MIDRLLSSIAHHTGAGLFAELDNIDPCSFDPLTDEPNMLAPERCGCAFGGGNSDDTDTMRDAVKVCQSVSAAYHERMKAAGLE